jgi:hypothetical protein
MGVDHFCPMIRSLHPLMTACSHGVRFAATWREEFFEVPLSGCHPNRVQANYRRTRSLFLEP